MASSFYAGGTNTEISKVLCYLSMKQDGKEIKASSLIHLSSCRLDVLSRRILCEAVSKALLKSRKMTSAGFLRSTRWERLS